MSANAVDKTLWDGRLNHGESAPSRSATRREAAQRGEPAPRFDAAMTTETGGDVVAVRMQTVLRDSAQLSTLPMWCRKEMECAADLIAQQSAELARLRVAIDSAPVAMVCASVESWQLAITMGEKTLEEQAKALDALDGQTVRLVAIDALAQTAAQEPPQ